MLEILHRGLHSHRLRPEANCPREVAFAEEWEKENNRDQFTTRASLLQQLMLLYSEHPRRGFFRDYLCAFGAPYRKVAFRIRRRDAVIVATIIQWLGSNIGFCFLEMALRRCGYKIVKIEKERDEKAKSKTESSAKA